MIRFASTHLEAKDATARFQSALLAHRDHSALDSIYRLRVRLSSFHPLPLGMSNPVEVIVSLSVAVALAMVLLPVAVWLSRSAGGEIIALPVGYTVPALVEPSPRVQQVVDVLFRIGVTAFVAGLALHMIGALKSHFVLKNHALKRMVGKHVEL